MGNGISIIEATEEYKPDGLFIVKTSHGPIYIGLVGKNGKLTLKMSSRIIHIEVRHMRVVDIIYIKMNVNGTEYNVYWYQNNGTIEVYHTKNANIIKFSDAIEFLLWMTDKM